MRTPNSKNDHVYIPWMSTTIGKPYHLQNTEETELFCVVFFFFFKLRVHVVLPARSDSPCARSRAAPVERTAAAVLAEPRREQSRGEPTRGAENHWLRGEVSHILSEFRFS